MPPAALALVPVAAPRHEAAPLAFPTPALTADAMRRLLAAFWAGRSPETLRSYRQSWADFAGFLSRREGRDLSETEAAALLIGRGPGPANELALMYQADLKGRRRRLPDGREEALAPGTVNLRTAALRSFVRMARTLGLIFWTLELRRLRAEVLKDTRGPGVEGFAAMLEKVAERSDAKARRDGALLSMLFDMGLRRMEVVGLDLAHLDLGAGTVSIRGKAREERETRTVPAATREALASWLELRGSAPGPLFLSMDTTPKGRGKRLTAGGLYAVVRAVGAAAGLGKVRPHGLRHAAITAALDAGESLRDVQRFSRHRDLRLLLIYDDNRKDIAGDVANRLAEHVRGLVRAHRAAGATK